MKLNACLCCPPPNNQRGAALILALLVVATVATMATYMHADFERSIRLAGNRLHSTQGQQFLQGGEALARFGLVEDLKDNQIDHLEEFWAKPQAFPFQGGGIALQLQDLQGRLNLNNLQGSVNGENNTNRGSIAQRFTSSQRRFIRLLQTFDELSLSEGEAIEITQAVIDWVDPDDNPTGFGGAESLYYQGAGEEFGVPGYRPANRAMKSVSELRLVKGVSAELYELLEPYVCALPVGVGLNVNTASSRVLRTLNISDQLVPLSTSDGTELEQARGNKGFEGLDAFFETDVMADLQNKAQQDNRHLNDELLSTSSGYFMLQAQAIVDERQSYTTTYLRRINSDNGISVRVIGRRLGK